MPRKATDTIQVADTPSQGKPHSQRSIVSQATASKAVRTKKIGAPTKYTEKLADELCTRISEGETLTKVCAALNISMNTVYQWAHKNPSFHEKYKLSRSNQATSLISQLVDEFRENLTNENALAARTKSDLYRWIAARQAPSDFGDSKRIELSAEINHRHVHELDPNQKRKIAESWLLSQKKDDDGILIEGEIMPEIGVQTIAEDSENRVIPKRKRPAVLAKTAVDPDSGGCWTKGRRE